MQRRGITTQGKFVGGVSISPKRKRNACKFGPLSVAELNPFADLSLVTHIPYSFSRICSSIPVIFRCCQ